MAIIEKIRNRAGLLVSVVIGAALIAFILGDFLSKGNVGSKSSRNNIVEVNGSGVPFEKYQIHLEKVENVNKILRNTSSLDEQTSKAIREQAWQDIVNDKVMEREYSKLGINIHGDELADLILGENPHMVVRQLFGDQRTGQLNPMVVQNFWQQTNQLEPSSNEMQIRLYIEDIIERDAKQQKYNALLTKGLYATKLEAKKRYEMLNKSADFSYVVKRYTEVSDSTLKVSDSDLKAYYKKHKEKYKQEKSRNIRYVYWNIVPTEKDKKDAQKWLNEALSEFKPLNAKVTWQYVKANSDIAVDDKNYMEGELPDALNDFAFNAKEGDIYGPYFEDNTYKVAKLVKEDYLPDSVRASHILLQINQNNYAQVQALADSLKTLIENGADFAELAKVNSTDGSRTDGGDLGWFQENKMVRPFNDSCFYGKTGDLKIVYSQFGIHIVKITKQSRSVKKVKVAVLGHEVRTEDADRIYFAKANEFGGKNRTIEQFNQALKDDPSLSVVNAEKITVATQNVNTLESSRQLVRWAFEAKEGTVSNEIYQFGDKYVVAVLDKINEKGYTPFDDIKGMINIEVRKEKKGEKLVAEMKNELSNVNDINAFASKLGTDAKTAANIRFTSYSIPQLGTEPRLIAAAVTLEEGKLSAPIAGNNGVYVIMVNNVTEAAEKEDFTVEKNYLERNFASKVNFKAPTVLKELAKVEDNRLTFF